MTLNEVKQDYLQQFKDADCKYLVLKMEDLMGSIVDWDQWNQLQNMLLNYNSYRKSQGKGINKYFIANRDEFPKIKTGDEYYEALKKIHESL